MSQSNTAANEMKSPLDAAQKIVAELQGMTKDDQSLAMKFAIETLRLEVTWTSQASSSLPALHAQTAGSFEVPSSVHAQPVDIKTFTAAKKPKSDQQFATVVAYYYQIEARSSERKAVIDPEVMKEAARLAGWPQVKRWAMTLHNAKNAGYLDPAGDGKFRLSSVGENLVAITLPGDAPASKGNVSRPRKKQAKKQNSSKFAKKRT
jgi:hypothetical protein